MKKIYLLAKYCSFIITCFLLQHCAAPSTKTVENAPVKDSFYLMNDFDKVVKYDTHVHIDLIDSSFILQSKKDNFHLLTINVDAGIPVEEQRTISLKMVKAFPDRLAFATTFNLKNWGTQQWVPQTINYLKESFNQGAIAVKIWKNIGMGLKDANGKPVMIDDPRFDTILNFIEQSNKTVLGHLGEPRNAWLPKDQMTISGDKEYFSNHPQYHMFLHPKEPSYMDQINARDNMLMKHPNLRFVGAHLGSLEWSVDELAARLDKFPNIAVDMAARIPHLQVQSVKNWQKVHDFIIKYQDRLLYATDQEMDAKSDMVAVNKSCHDIRMSDWKFFVTDNEMTVADFPEKFKGLKLPKDVVDKIYRTNAKKWYHGI